MAVWVNGVKQGGSGGGGGASGWSAPFTPQNFSWDNANASGPIGWAVAQLNTAKFKATGEGLQNSTATQQSGTIQATLATPPDATSLDTDNAFKFVLFGDSGTTGQCKYDLTIYGYDEVFEGITAVDSLTNQVAGYSGTHDGSANAATLSDSTASFTTDNLIGSTIYNVTDGSSGVITENDGTTITATLSGGTDDDWDVSDAYYIDAPTVLTLATTDLTDSTLFDYYTVSLKLYSKDDDAIYLIGGSINGS